MPCQSKLHWAAIKLITGTRPRRCSILQSLEIDFPKFLDTPSYYCLVELKLRIFPLCNPMSRTDTLAVRLSHGAADGWPSSRPTSSNQLPHALP
ncbi:Os08g0325001 [Oryza sativa Japonica Group]|uniref:Os08g0325001 protein n=1 Tax=Oryza sativa subsp. japonica TaxID=39947 RepID=A0A0P0XEC2_ORYSJ|nr:Os08g0325001 [Oryza sativa Japonica Group]